MKTFRLVLIISMYFSVSYAQPHRMPVSVLDNGGGYSIGDGFKLLISVGQPFIGIVTDSKLVNEIGYLPSINGITDSTPLPIQLASFIASLDNNCVRLEWVTVSEINNYGFYIQRRMDKQPDFNPSPLGFVEGAGTSLELHEYVWIDSSITSPGEYHYRLKQMDLNGVFTYSPVVSVTLYGILYTEQSELPTEYVLNQNHPNPFNPSTVISYALPDAGYVRLVLYNALGQEVAILVNQVKEAGYYTVRFDASNHPSGLYTYRLTTGSYAESKKMLIVR